MTAFQGREEGSNPPSGLVGCGVRIPWLQPRAGMRRCQAVWPVHRGGSMVVPRWFEGGLSGSLSRAQEREGRRFVPGLRPFFSLFISFNGRWKTRTRISNAFSIPSLLLYNIFTLTSLAICVCVCVYSFTDHFHQD